MEKERIVEQARLGFDPILHTEEYRRVHGDASHLETLLHFMGVRPEKRYLDLGTGNGYLAFELARRSPAIEVTGIDIAIQAIRRNRELQREQGIGNLDFLSYDGIRLPFPDGLFDGAISRYAFHHFPDPAASVQELYRITGSQGFVIISDPMTHEEDTAGFIDHWQRIKADGHVHFYWHRKWLPTRGTPGKPACGYWKKHPRRFGRNTVSSLGKTRFIATFRS